MVSRTLLDGLVVNVPEPMALRRIHGANWYADNYRDPVKIEGDLKHRAIFKSELNRWLSQRGLKLSPQALETERLEIFRRQVLLEGLRARPEQAYDIWRGGLHPRPAMFQAWFRILTVLMAVVSPSLYLALYDFYAENPWRRIGSIFNRKQ
jgi:hypothetical protein